MPKGEIVELGFDIDVKHIVEYNDDIKVLMIVELNIFIDDKEIVELGDGMEVLMPLWIST